MGSERAEARAGASTAAASTAAASFAATEPSSGNEELPAGDQAAALTPQLELRIEAYRNVRYHEDRQGFFEAAARWTNFFIVVAGSGAAATSLADHPHVAAGAAALSAVIGAVQLVFDLAGKARTHLELRKAFVRILAEASAPDADPAALEVAMIRLYADEPEVFYAVSALAYNAAQTRYSRPRSTLLDVSRWQRRFRHLLRFEPSDFKDARAD